MCFKNFGDLQLQTEFVEVIFSGSLKRENPCSIKILFLNLFHIGLYIPMWKKKIHESTLLLS